jgi:hypothetical protein
MPTPKDKRFPFIEEYTDDELEAAICTASSIPGFWAIMRGVDAYLERRKRREANREAVLFARFHQESLRAMLMDD